MNFNGTCHGGIIFAVADMAFGLAANSYGVVAPAINANITNHASAGDSDRLTASATETSRSKRMASYLVNVVRGDGRKVATFTASVFVTNKPHDAASGS
ncbi:MAG: PaaI family thioesterase [Alphaproteobacteria bacterium]